MADGPWCPRCGKRLHSGERAARKVAARLRRRDLGQVPWRAYYDGGCRQWHVTSKAPRFARPGR